MSLPVLDAVATKTSPEVTVRYIYLKLYDNVVPTSFSYTLTQWSLQPAPYTLSSSTSSQYVESATLLLSHPQTGLPAEPPVNPILHASG